MALYYNSTKYILIDAMKGTSTCSKAFREPGAGETRRPNAEKITPKQQAENSSKPGRGLPVIVCLSGPNCQPGWYRGLFSSLSKRDVFILFFDA